jgi:ABC-type multidrug transport system ATPase subunit
MSRPAPPALTVRYDGSERAFAPGHDVVIGRDLRADMRVAHPLVSRAHLLLRFDQGRWMAIDNGSLNGVFVNGHRVPVVDIRDGQKINLGNPDGPSLDFEVGRHLGAAGRPPRTEAVAIPQPHPAGQPHAAPGWHPEPGHHPAPGHQPENLRPPPGTPTRPPENLQPRPSYPADQPETRMAPAAAKPPESSNFATKMIDILRPGAGAEMPSSAITIGRATDNDIVVTDVLASRRHATLVPTQLGQEIRDNGSINGTFVNGIRVGSAILTEGDTVTIGNVDLTFTGGSLVRRSEPAARTGGLEVGSVSFDIDGKRLLNDISLTAKPGTLTAIIGGSGAGKTTLSRLIAGYTHPSAGAVTFEGHNIHTEYASLRSRIGMVPQDDVVHRQLTVNQALGYAAELRLPPDTSQDDRDQAVAQVLEELQLTKHADTRVDNLSGGQRKRASVALELLTGPSLLLLDEPTSGLDPALDRQVMLMLRELADAGRVVLVVTHSVAYLDVCDQILLMAPGGKTAFCGPPDDIGPAMGTTNWADIFASVGADPDEANRRFLASAAGKRAEQAEHEQPGDLGAPTSTSLRRQLSTIARRQVRLVVSDRGYTLFLAALPFVVGLVVLTVPGPKPGLGVADPMGTAPTQPQYIMVFLNFGAVFMGVALTIRDLIGERPIFKREQAVGLSTTAYLLAKIVVFCAFAVIQAGIATAIVTVGKGTPTQSPQLFGNATFALFVTVAGTCVASAVLGLTLSAFAQTNEQIMPLLVVSVLLQLVLSGGIIPMVDADGASKVLNYPSWVTPARWGYAAGASSIDLPKLVNVPQIHTKDPIWQHSQHIYVFDMAMLAVLSLVYGSVVWWRIRLK